MGRRFWRFWLGSEARQQRVADDLAPESGVKAPHSKLPAKGLLWLEAVVLNVVVSPHASEAGTSDKERSE